VKRKPRSIPGKMKVFEKVGPRKKRLRGREKKGGGLFWKKGNRAD